MTKIPQEKYIRVRTGPEVPDSLRRFIEPQENGKTLFEAMDEYPAQDLEWLLSGPWGQKLSVATWANDCYQYPEGCLISHGTTIEKLPFIAKKGLVTRSSTDTYGDKYTGRNVYGIPRTRDLVLPSSGLLAGRNSKGLEWYWALIGLRLQEGEVHYKAPTAEELAQLAVVRFRLGNKPNEFDAEFQFDPHFLSESVRFKRSIPANKLSFFLVDDPKKYARLMKETTRNKLSLTSYPGELRKTTNDQTWLYSAFLTTQDQLVERELTRKQVLNMFGVEP